jgi:hypothetical protein
MNPEWDTPPGGDFASYVERLTQQSALRALAPRPRVDMQSQQAQGMDAQQAASSQSPQSSDSFDSPAMSDEAVARARALFAAPGRQLQSDHPLVRGLRLALKKLESSLLQDIARQQQKK